MDIKEIARHIISSDKDSCLAYNSKGDINGYYEEELYKECKDYYLYEKLGICGCGRPDDTVNVIREVLNTIDKYKYKSDETRDEQNERYNNKWKILYNLCGVNLEENTNYYGLLQLVFYILNDKDFLEHGSSVGGSWLTKEGEMFLFVLNNCELDLD